MEANYKIISYTVHNQNTQEMIVFHCEKYHWSDARTLAIEKATSWKENSPLENKYEGVALILTYGIEDDPEHVFMIHILTGSRMNNAEITQALWDEATIYNYLGYNFDSTILEDENGITSDVIADKHTILYYFTA